MALSAPLPVCKPIHTVRSYTDDCWKVVTFKRSGIDSVGCHYDRLPDPPPDGKWRQAFVRARSTVLDLALSNKWDYFATFTIDESKHDRFNLYGFLDDFSQWIRDERKRSGADIKFLVVPEYHAKGGVHAHGLLAGLDFGSLKRFGSFTDPVPAALLDADKRWRCYSWLPYHSKFGFCSCSPVRDVVASAFYIAKYLSKTFDDRASDFGRHLFRASRGLRRSEVVAEGYVYDQRLADLCVNQSYFCCSGFVTSRQSSESLRTDWAFPYQFRYLEMLNEDGLFPDPVSDLVPAAVPDAASVDSMCEDLAHYEQCVLEGCGYGS